MRECLDRLRLLPYGIFISHAPGNDGFSAAVNKGIRSGRRMLRDPRAAWFFICNADSVFPSGSLRKFATDVNQKSDTHGLLYGNKIDHFAFAITHMAVAKAGYLDEAFFPGYMEDIDYRWRTLLAGLPGHVTGAHFEHKHSVNLNKPSTGNYKSMLRRASNGWEYGWSKWGPYTSSPNHLNANMPPSGWKTPFNIKSAPLSLWAVDPAHRRCIRTGIGVFHSDGSSTCWYNGTVLLSHLPEGTILPEHLTQVGPTGRHRYGG